MLPAPYNQTVCVSGSRLAWNERGIALIITLWVIIILGITATYFSRGIRGEAYIVRNFEASERAKLLALAGVHHALAYLSRSTEEGMEIDQDYLEGTVSEIDSVPFAGGSYHVMVTDEESKININEASREIIRDLMIGYGLSSAKSDSLSDAIIDWRDRDDDPMVNGAESRYYLSLNPPYSSKNLNLDSLEELLLVRGFTPELLYGNEASADSGQGFARLLTVYGRGKVNINTASRAVLEALPGVDEQSAQFIVAGREAIDYTPLTKHEFIRYLQELNPGQENEPEYQALQRLADSKSYHFTIVSRGRVDRGGLEKRLKVVVYRSVLGSRVNIRVFSWNEFDPAGKTGS